MTGDQSEIILSYRLPWWGHGILSLLSLVIVGSCLSLFVLGAGRIPLIVYLVFWVEWLFIIGLLVWLLIQQPIRVIVAITCTPIVMEVRTLFGKKTIIPWQGILQFKRLRARMTYLDTYRDSYLIVPLPRPILTELLALMRKFNSIRIVGFD
ncbi:MAG TPA: hypothetical protein VFI02_03870 [Armatimonadota bacterium]|nr:hypothetical protein [Armatimonadota bacterium]